MKFNEIYFWKLKFVEILSNFQILSILLSYWPHEIIPQSDDEDIISLQ